MSPTATSTAGPVSTGSVGSGPGVGGVVEPVDGSTVGVDPGSEVAEVADVDPVAVRGAGCDEHPTATAATSSIATRIGRDGRR